MKKISKLSQVLEGIEARQLKIGNNAATFFSKRGMGKKNAREIGKGAAFLLFWAGFFAAFSVLGLAVPDALEELPVAQVTQGYLGLLGMDSVLEFGEPVLVQVVGGPLLVFSYLCTGVFEFTVLASAMLASGGISWRARFIGVAVGAVATVAFNFARIFATLHAILSTPVEIVDFVHGTLFRATLLVVIVGVYGGWFWWATRQNKHN